MLEEKITLDKLVRWILCGLIILAVFYITNSMSEVLLPFFIACLLAYLLYPLVRFTEKYLHIRIRALSILFVLILLIGIITGIGLLIVPSMIEQFEKLSDVTMHYLSQTAQTNSLTNYIRQWIQEHQRDIDHFLKSQDFSDTIKTAMPQVFSFVGQTASVVISIIASFITLLYMFFILLDYEFLTDNWIKIFPKKNRPFWTELSQDVARELNNYIRGQSLVSLIMGILFCIGFTIIDFPMAIGLGIMIGIMNLVPYLHTFALIPTAILALLKAADTGQNFWIIFGSAFLVFAVVQVISDMVVTPKVMGKAMGLNPAILLLSLSVWGSLFGFIGLIIALPLTTLIMAYWQRYVTKEHEKDEKEVKAIHKNATPSEKTKE
ncbi:AI-2E family transporter [Hoylesella saccharolytica]|uniref:AI-2E family transporter n=1 Tax=Hoylesella saccharolytica TaxID=633701 RepID=UPI0028EE4868|nr:AI-2E family transporter [Hoylesella saccharolytica]